MHATIKERSYVPSNKMLLANIDFWTPADTWAAAKSCSFYQQFGAICRFQAEQGDPNAERRQGNS